MSTRRDRYHGSFKTNDSRGLGLGQGVLATSIAELGTADDQLDDIGDTVSLRTDHGVDQRSIGELDASPQRVA